MKKKFNLIASCVLLLNIGFASNIYGQKNLLPVLAATGPKTLEKIPVAVAPAVGKTIPAIVQQAQNAAKPMPLALQNSLLPPARLENLPQKISQQINASLSNTQTLQEKLKRKKIALFDANAIEKTAFLTNPYLRDIIPLSPTAFFIEEIYEGKKYIWGVTAAHAADCLLPDIMAHLTILDSFPLEFPVKIVAKGNTGMADIALFSVPQEMEEFIRPIPISSQEVQVNENLRSYGFFESDFHIVRNRRVLAATPSRIITSFEFGKHDRAGACGGPLINENNELVGIHCGSSEKKQESYAVPVSFLKDLMEAAHHNGIKQRNLVVNGKTVGQINIDEYIYSLNVTRLGITLKTFLPWHEESNIDYDHLENAIPLDKASELNIIIVKKGTLQTAFYDNPDKKMIVVDLKTGKTKEYEL